MKPKKLFCLLLSVVMTMSLLTAFAQDDPYPDIPAKVAPTEQITCAPSQNNAYTVLGDTVTSNKMTYIDGIEQGITDTSNPLYSQKFEMAGVKGRKVFKQNILYFKLDHENHDFSGSKYLLLVTYYDFGPDKGFFHVEYNSTSSPNKRISVEKPGTVPKWSTAKIYIDDAAFKGAMENGADIRIVTGYYNAFSKIELIDISKADQNTTVINYDIQDKLASLGLYDKTNADGSQAPALSSDMRRIVVLEAILKAVGCRGEIDAAPATSDFVDVSGKNAKVLNVAEKYNLASMPWDKKFNPNDICTIREMLTFYLRYLGYSSPDLYDNALEKAISLDLVKSTDLIITPDKPVTRDNFVAIAYNALTATYKTSNEETVLVADLLKKGAVDYDMATSMGLSAYRLFIAGDSIAAKYAETSTTVGWGMIIPDNFEKDVAVVNYAQAGSSTKTFPNMAPILNNIGRNDFVIMQFGHNDSMSDSRGVDVATYMANMKSFVQQIRAKGATPIIATSTCCYLFEEGKFNYNIDSDGIMKYRNAAKQVAQQNDVAFIDVAYLMTQRASGYTKEQLDEMYVDEGYNNRVHLTQKGAEFVAKIISDEIKANAKLTKLSPLVK